MEKRDTLPIIRQLLWTERDTLRDHLLRLTPQDRRGRFASAANDTFIQRYVDGIDWNWNSYRALGAFVDGELIGAGECRIFGSYWQQEAELAFSVEQLYQCHGIGGELFRRLVAMARNRGMQRLCIVTEPHNAAMQAVARNNGMRLRTLEDVEGLLELEGPTPLSVAEEWVGESTAWLCTGLAFLNRQLRLTETAN